MKSDDVIGRVRTYEAIIKGTNIPQPGIPESFKVLLKELQSLGLDMTLEDEDGNEVRLKEASEYGTTDFNAIDRDMSRNMQRDNESEFAAAGYTSQEFNEQGELVNVDVEEEVADEFDADAMDLEPSEDFDMDAEAMDEE